MKCYLVALTLHRSPDPPRTALRFQER
jgi:hypothetical protein